VPVEGEREQLMGGNPRVVTADVKFTWDHATQRLGRGTIIDVPAGSALEHAIGPERLIPLYGAPPAAVPQASEPEPEPAQEKVSAPRSPAKATAAAKGGGDAT
jgi:hypothetical protein